MTNLFVFSHGWNNDVAGAKALYSGMFPIIKTQAGAGAGPARRIGFVGVVWPSILFPDDPGRAAVPDRRSAAQAIEAAQPAPVNVTTLKTGAQITADMAKSLPDRSGAGARGDGQDHRQGPGRHRCRHSQHRRADRNVQRFHALLQQISGPPDGRCRGWR